MSRSAGEAGGADHAPVTVLSPESEGNKETVPQSKPCCSEGASSGSYDFITGPESGKRADRVARLFVRHSQYTTARLTG
jgi:hypothetical protein